MHRPPLLAVLFLLGLGSALSSCASATVRSEAGPADATGADRVVTADGPTEELSSPDAMDASTLDSLALDTASLDAPAPDAPLFTDATERLATGSRCRAASECVGGVCHPPDDGPYPCPFLQSGPFCTDTSCSADSFCLTCIQLSAPRAVCTPRCRSNADCRAEQTECGPAGRCVYARCAGNSDCLPWFTCAMGACSRRSCSLDSECNSGACVSGACYARPGTCEGPES